MLYKTIRKAREEYHSCGYGNDYDTALACYRDALKKRRSGCSPDKPSYEEAWILLSFANGWNARMRASFLDVRCALEEIGADLERLEGRTILDVCLDDKETQEAISRSLKKLANCYSKERNEATGASKILHIINPDLFVMWDGAIRSGYICKLQGKLEKKDWIWYTEYLCEMQQLAKCVVEQAKANEQHHSDKIAIASLTGCKHTLAKVLDEYNFMKFTKTCDAVWKAVYESCSSPQDIR